MVDTVEEAEAELVNPFRPSTAPSEVDMGQSMGSAVGAAVVGSAVVGFAVVGLAVVGLAVVGLFVVVVVSVGEGVGEKVPVYSQSMSASKVPVTPAPAEMVNVIISAWSSFIV